MAYVPAQTSAVMNSDLTALNAQLAVLKGVRAAFPAGTNPRDMEHVGLQIKELQTVIRRIQTRLNRLAKLGA
jgi:hypothetical protein